MSSTTPAKSPATTGSANLVPNSSKEDLSSKKRKPESQPHQQQTISVASSGTETAKNPESTTTGTSNGSTNTNQGNTENSTTSGNSQNGTTTTETETDSSGKLLPSIKKAKSEPPAVIRFVPWQLLTMEVMCRCITFRKPSPTKSGPVLVGMRFNYSLFKQICKEKGWNVPEIQPEEEEILYTNFPFLHTPFGYGSYKPEKGDTVNQLRFELDRFVSEDAKKFRGPSEMDIQECIRTGAEVKFTGVQEWDQFFVQAILGNYPRWKDAIPVLEHMQNRPTDPPPDVRMITSKWKRIGRASASFCPYIQMKIKTEDDNIDIAFLRVWTKEGKLITSKLLPQNSVNFPEGPDKKAIFPKSMYGSGIMKWNHINFMTNDYGLTTTLTDLKIATREEVDEHVSQDGELVCPISDYNPLSTQA